MIASASQLSTVHSPLCIPSGYKQTEVGVIPQEWDIQPLNRTIERLEAGVSVNSVEDNLTDYSHNHAVLKTSAVTEGKFLPRECKKIAPRDLKRVRLSPRVDTILISRMNTPDLVGECGYVDRDYDNLFLPDRLWMTKQRNGSDASIRWLSYLLSSKPQKTRIKELATGTSGSMKNLAKGAFLELQIPAPPPPEQSAIAVALSDVDALLASLDRIIAKKRDIKQAAMQQLLSGQTRLPGFHEKWEVKRLGDVANIKTGSRNNENKVEDGKYSFFVRSDVVEHINSYSHDCEAILVPGEGRIGSIFHYINGKFDVHQRVYAITQFKPHISGLFIHFYLSKNFGAWAMQNTVKATVDSLRLPTFLTFEMKLSPTKDEQTAIAAVLSDMDAELAALEQRRDKTLALKQGMMQELLTGKTRLI